MSAQILAVANQKGGVGKTTTTVNLAASLASKGRRVLVVDLDPQGNATTGSGINKATIENGVYQVVLGETDIPDAVVRSKEGGYDVLGANRTLAGAEVELVQEIAREIRLKNALQLVADNYDYVLIDCPPSLTLLTLNGLVAANGVVVPMLCEYYALEGISDLIATVRKIRQAINPNLEVLGIVRAGADSRVVQSLMRHESLATPGRYLAVNTDQQRAALSGLHPTPNATQRRVDAGPDQQQPPVGASC